MGVKLAIYPTKTSKINNKSKKFKTGIVLSCIFAVLFVLLAFNFFQILTKIFVGTFGLLIYPVVWIIVMIFRPQGLLGTKEVSFEALFAFFKNFGKKGSKGVEKNVRK